ncbi:hypothetical protein ALC60_13091 [Trachymyrmex zeteki]|uniref:Uncharacterized protein n=1 Tax=Mycetomoellerius zeteki TaxID=64791 RepID=A0A151WJ52_9HYME|nr:hypothetical protein ALC60_13091 [Trachymyrmex zeteki]
METHISNCNKSSKDIVNVLAILCQIHNVNMEELSSIVKNKQNFNNYELWMSEQLSKQLVNVEVYIISETTLECDPDAVDESQLPDCEMYDNNDDNDSQDQEYNPPPSKEARVITTNVSPHKFKKAWRDWTKQKDSTKSTDYKWKNFLGKGKKRAMNKIVTYFHFNHDPQLKSLKRWAERKNRGIISMRELNKIIYEQFLDHRSNNRIITDRMLRLWAMKQRNLLGNEIAEKFVASITWLYNISGDST